MVIYFIVFFMLSTIGLLKCHYNLKKELVLPIVAFILIFFAAFRGEYVDKDYQNYLESFSEFLGPLDYFKNMGDWFFYEPFFYLIPSILKTIGFPHFEIFVFLFFSVLAVSINVRNIEKFSSFPILTIVTWFGFYFLLHELTQIRAAVATGLMLHCMYLHYHKNYFKFLIVFFIALMFHYSSLLILPILLINPFKFSLKINLSILLLSLFLGFIHSDIFIRPVFLIDAAFVKKLTLTLQAMNEDENSINFFNPMFIGQVFITIWLFFNHHLLIKENKYSYILLKLQLLSIVSLCAFSSIAFIAYRISEFYGIVSIFTIPLLVFTFRQKIYGYIAVVSYSLVLLTLTVVIAKLVGPYKLVFF